MISSFRKFYDQIRLWYQNLILPRHFPKELGSKCYAIATKKGLYKLKEGKVIKLTNQECYGITLDRVKDTFYCLEEFKTHSQIYTCSIKEFIQTKSLSFTKFGPELNSGVHQIDWYNQKLYVTNTYKNSILEITPQGTIAEEYFPFGELDKGRESDNYKHINSIYFKDNRCFIFLHNDSKKTGRFSEIALLDKDFKLETVLSTSSRSGHNIFFIKDKICHLNSLENSIKVNDLTVANLDYFTRGASVTEDVILIGGSDYVERSKRHIAAGKIYAFDLDFKLFFTLPIPGMVQEIRCLNKTEKTISTEAKRENEIHNY